LSDVIYLLFHLLTTAAKPLRPGGGKTIIAENLHLMQQLIIHSRARQRAPNLSATDRALPGFWSLLLNPLRIARSAIIIKPSALPRFHNALKKGKYQQLIPPRGGRKPKTACGAEAPDRSIYSGVNRFY
jgi:putative transposase